MTRWLTLTPVLLGVSICGALANAAADIPDLWDFDQPALSETRFRAALEGLAIDAAHMIALVEPGLEEQLAWNRRGLELARNATDTYARNWQASLHNNIGWSLHDAGRYDEALAEFELVLKERERRVQLNEIRIAKWAVARCLRSLGRRDEALAIQRALKAELAAEGKEDQYVLEELRNLGSE